MSESDHMPPLPCIWCYVLSAAGRMRCRECGHNPHAARIACDCSDCSHERWRAQQLAELEARDPPAAAWRACVFRGGD